MTLKEPARRGLVKGKPRSVKVMDVARYMAQDWRTYAAVIGGTAMKYLMTLGSSQWLPTLFRREFKWELAKIGVVLGTVMIVASVFGLMVGGKLSERWAKQGRSDANLRIMLYALIFSAPLAIVYPLIPDPWLMMAAHAISTFAAAVGVGPGIAAFQVITPNQMRAQVSSVSQFCTNVLAFALGPLIVALFTDYLFADPQDLKYSMTLCSAILGPLTILLVAQGLKPYARAYERSAREFAN
jgi:MFS family permease